MSLKLARPLRLLLLGAPGAGKGTQTSKLLKVIPELKSVSSGDILRNELKSGTELGVLASKYIAQGRLIPDKVITQVLMSHLSNEGWLNPQSSWLLDGFPRTENQALNLDKTLSQNNAMLNLVIELDVPEEVILERINNRYIHAASGRVYNLQYNPPKVPGKDDITGEPLVKRLDDNAQTFKRRMKEYKQTLGPIKEHYSKQGILVSVSGETSDIIFPKLCRLINDHFGQKKDNGLPHDAFEKKQNYDAGRITSRL
ncbi:GTP:AMP phosphotransferase, mitochondrial [Nakaseomyces bracarensis]|uniref:GTP:AMP phosphotransferase, mitochondrial n=1 Tax=Nakaseomyces bracarensis TaxID=273131 RepID=A0ABR4NXN3_9SACH